MHPAMKTQLAKQSPASFYSPRCTDAFRYETQLATHSSASFYNLRYAHALSYETHTNVLPLPSIRAAFVCPLG